MANITASQDTLAPLESGAWGNVPTGDSIVVDGVKYPRVAPAPPVSTAVAQPPLPDVEPYNPSLAYLTATPDQEGVHKRAIFDEAFTKMNEGKTSPAYLGPELTKPEDFELGENLTNEKILQGLQQGLLERRGDEFYQVWTDPQSGNRQLANIPIANIDLEGQITSPRYTTPSGVTTGINPVSMARDYLMNRILSRPVTGEEFQQAAQEPMQDQDFWSGLGTQLAENPLAIPKTARNVMEMFTGEPTRDINLARRDVTDPESGYNIGATTGDIANTILGSAAAGLASAGLGAGPAAAGAIASMPTATENISRAQRGEITPEQATANIVTDIGMGAAGGGFASKFISPAIGSGTKEVAKGVAKATTGSALVDAAAVAGVQAPLESARQQYVDPTNLDKRDPAESAMDYLPLGSKFDTGAFAENFITTAGTSALFNLGFSFFDFYGAKRGSKPQVVDANTVEGVQTNANLDRSQTAKETVDAFNYFSDNLDKPNAEILDNFAVERGEVFTPEESAQMLSMIDQVRVENQRVNTSTSIPTGSKVRYAVDENGQPGVNIMSPEAQTAQSNLKQPTTPDGSPSTAQVVSPNAQALNQEGMNSMRYTLQNLDAKPSKDAPPVNPDKIMTLPEKKAKEFSKALKEYTGNKTGQFTDVQIEGLADTYRQYTGQDNIQFNQDQTTSMSYQLLDMYNGNAGSPFYTFAPESSSFFTDLRSAKGADNLSPITELYARAEVGALYDDAVQAADRSAVRVETPIAGDQNYR